ncbi:MAG: pyrroline-5-carboxylate reductase [bacterium]|nr:pyrroline-5-carboxylate reductase [bacterium]
MKGKKITIIGAGNMGSAITRGLVQNGIISGKNITVTDPSPERLQEVKKLDVKISNDNKKSTQRVDIVILAVKPDIVPIVLSEIKESLSKKQLVVSIAAGVEIKTIKKLIGEKQPIVRVMPNLCATIGMSMSCWVASSEVSKHDRKLIKIILAGLGREYFIDDEGLLDKITVISGSGPAYIFYLVELLEITARKLGLKNELVRILAVQTVIGSAELLKNSKKSAGELRAAVISKGGVTEAIFAVLEKLKFGDVFFKAIRAGVKRAKELRLLH